MLDVSWQQFQELELWQIRSRAFVTGESVVDEKIRRLDALVSAQIASMQNKPREYQQQRNEFYLKAVTIEKELTAEEADEIKRKHNQSFFDELKAKHHGSRK